MSGHGFLPGTASLVEEVDSTLHGSASIALLNFRSEKLLVTLRDGRKLVGILRSFDQFGTCSRSKMLRD